MSNEIFSAQDALDHFCELARGGRVVNMRTGKPGDISESLRKAIVSTAAAAFRHGAGKSDLSTIAYHALAHDLPVHAAEDARERGLADASNRAARARRFVRSVDGQERVRRRSGVEALPSAWIPLYRVLMASKDRSGGRARFPGYLTNLAQLALRNGVTSPAELPDRYTLQDWLLEAGKSRDPVYKMLAAYRRARGLLLESDPSADLPDIDRCPVRAERGIRSLPDICERLQASGCDAPPAEVPVLEVIRLVAPNWHRYLREYLDAHRDNAAGWHKRALGACSRALALLSIGGYEDPANAHPCALLLRRVEREDFDSVVQFEENDELSELIGDSQVVEEDASEAEATESLFCRLARDAVDASTTRSPLELRTTEEEKNWWWTHTIRDDARHLRQFAEWVGTRTPRIRGSVKWTMAVTEAQEFERQMGKESRRAPLYGKKAKAVLLNLVTYPTAICLGVPALRRKVYDLREIDRDCRARFGGEEHPRVSSASAKYEAALYKYLIFSIMLADGLRVANYAGARLGPADQWVATRTDGAQPVSSFSHVLPSFDKGGRIQSVTLHFHGDDHPRVKLKIDRTSNGDFRRRVHHLRPGIVDFELLYDYLTRVRPRNLVRQGLIESVESYDLDQDLKEQHFALFVSPARSLDPYARVTGGYSPDSLSRVFGETLHWVCSEVLDRELPPFGSRELSTSYRGLFAAHVSRLLVGTYWYGIRNRQEMATALTDDTIEVVRRRYCVTESDMVHKTGWESPHHFDGLMDRIFANEQIDWDQEDSLNKCDHGIGEAA